MFTDENDYIFYDDGKSIYLFQYFGSVAEIALPEYDGGKEYGIWNYAFYNGYITATCLKMHAEIFENSLVIPH